MLRLPTVTGPAAAILAIRRRALPAAYSRALQAACSRAPRAARRSLLVSAAVLLTAALAAPTAALAAPTAGLAAAAGTAPASRCASVVAPAAPIATVPWPQQRYDLAALGQLTDGRGVTVAVIDSGVDPSHPQLAGRVRPGADLLDPAGTGQVDCLGHGTAVASIIAATPMPGSGLRGVAPGVRILPIRVSERVAVDAEVSGRGVDAGGLADGIRRAVAAGAQVINLSISVGADDPRLRDAVAAALDADVVVVAAVGNGHDRGDPIPYPAAYPGVVGVGAIGPSGARAPSSSIGSYVDIVAPGDGVIGAVPGRGHAVYQGTSFATPFVSATAALIRAHRPELSGAEVVRRLLATADPASGLPAEYGRGVLNPLRAVTELVPPPAAPPEPAPPVAAPTGPAGAGPSGAGPAGASPTGSGSTLGLSPAGALGVAAALGLAALVLVILATLIPSGRRRRWRPGLASAAAPAPTPNIGDRRDRAAVSSTTPSRRSRA